jgi:hypothetical protein
MYSHARYIQARHLSFFFALNWYPALETGIGPAFIWNQDRICRYSLGFIGESRTVKSRLRRHYFCEDGEIRYQSRQHVDDGQLLPSVGTAPNRLVFL